MTKPDNTAKRQNSLCLWEFYTIFLFYNKCNKFLIPFYNYVKENTSFLETTTMLMVSKDSVY